MATIHALAEEWRTRWNDLKDGQYPPPVVTEKLVQLNEIARELAHSASSRQLDHAETVAITEIELLILREELHSPVISQGI